MLNAFVGRLNHDPEACHAKLQVRAKRLLRQGEDGHDLQLTVLHLNFITRLRPGVLL